MKDEMSVTADLLRIKKIIRDIQQTSYSLKKFEDKFPDIEFAGPKEMKKYIKIVLAYKNEIEENLEDLKPLYEKYKNE